MKINLINDIDLNLSPAYQVLVNRGIPESKIRDFLNTSDEVINSYMLLDNIEDAAKTLLYHVNKLSNILIQVDSDVDGFTSAATLYNWIKGNFPEANLHYQVHDEKTHGLHITEDILANKYELIIVPDAGSNEYEKHKRVHDLGIKLIILDHHETEYYSEDACVVNNQMSENYPNKAMSGVGVVWQFCRALDHINPFVQTTVADDYLDLVALGLIADMMDTRELETKRLIEKGIDAMKDSFSPGGNSFLSAFIQKQAYSLKNTVTPIGLAWYIAPFINSVVRVGTPEERLLTFEAMLQENAKISIPSTKRGGKGQTETVIEQAIRTLTNVKNRQKKQTDELFEKYESKITDDYLNENSIILLEIDNKTNPNLKGLVANKIASKYQRPTFILSSYTETSVNLVLKETVVENDEGGQDLREELVEVKKTETYFTGSARNIDTNILPDFKGFITETGLAEYAEGHASALGVKFTKDNLEQFLELATNSLDFTTSYTEYNVDFIFDMNELRPGAILDVASLKDYWGKGIEESIIAIKNVKVTEDMKTLMSRDKNPTLKLIINEVEVIKFRCSEEEFDAIAPNQYTTSIMDIVGKCSINEWNGNITAQILIEDYEIIQNIVEF